LKETTLGTPRAHGRRPVMTVVPLLVAGCVMLTPVLLGGCASGNKLLNREMRVPFSAEQREALSGAKTIPYRLQRGDVVSVLFQYEKDLNQFDVLVLPDGSATFVGLDRVLVAGKTVAEVDSLLTAGYAQQYRDPDLSIVVERITGRPVYVMGEVRNPGLYDVAVEGLGVLGAIAMAGGFQPNAAQGEVVQIRVSPDGYLCRELNLKSMRDTKKVDAQVFDLQPYDIIYVTRDWIGDFAAFSRDVVGSFLQYTQFLLNARYINDPSAIWRR
jgi:protein involved in polysaccharide export with SLBB domain